MYHHTMTQALPRDLPQGTTLGPDSLTWQLFGDVRMVLIGPRAGVLQNMLPSLGQGVEEHSVWFADTLARLRRSIPPIFGTVYDADGEATGRRVRDFHRTIKGRLPDGSPYSALNPHTYYWAHACFVDSMVAATETFIRPLSLDEKDRIIAESVAWYARYGVSEPVLEAGVPRTWREFEAYFEHMLDTELVRHRTAAYGMGYTTKGWPRPKRLHPLVWAVLRRPVNAVSSSLSIGGMPPRGRDVLGLPWDERRERRYRRFAAAVRAVDPLIRRLPRRWRMHPIAAGAFAREGR
jgi:uncharacterized protein (DUF2236 family)